MNELKSKLLPILGFILLFIGFNCCNVIAADDRLSKEDTKDLIDQLNTEIKRQYLKQELCDDIHTLLEKKLADGEFYDITTNELASKLTNALREKTNDLHFYVGVIRERRQPTENRERRPQNNTSLDTVKVLDGNIGYIKWKSFIANDESFKEMDKAIGIVKNCDALIIDIARNPGGDGRNGGYLNQFLYKEKDYQDLLLKRCTNDENWFRSEVPYNYEGGTNLFDMPLYVIISKHTFSAAEYFAFITQEMKRGTIMGEKTPGGGHPVNSVIIKDKFQVLIPVCEIQTRDGKNFEGQGVSPEVELHSNDWVQETVKYIKSVNEK